MLSLFSPCPNTRLQIDPVMSGHLSGGLSPPRLDTRVSCPHVYTDVSASRHINTHVHIEFTLSLPILSRYLLLSTKSHLTRTIELICRNHSFTADVVRFNKSSSQAEQLSSILFSSELYNTEQEGLSL